MAVSSSRSVVVVMRQLPLRYPTSQQRRHHLIVCPAAVNTIATSSIRLYIPPVLTYSDLDDGERPDRGHACTGLGPDRQKDIKVDCLAVSVVQIDISTEAQ